MPITLSDLLAYVGKGIEGCRYERGNVPQQIQKDLRRRRHLSLLRCGSMTRYVTSGKGRIAAAAFGLVIGTIQGAQADDPAATAKALELLLSISNDPIPDASTCFGDYGQPGKARLRDLLATELAYLYAGSNVITGTCKGDVCSVSITHAAGEDVSSAEISFSVKRGKASAASLKCVITPWL